MAEKVVALIGGDNREFQVVPALKAGGWKVQVFGLPVDALPTGVVCCETIEEALDGALAIILPLPGVRNDGTLHAPFIKKTKVTKSDFARVPTGTPILVGVASDYLKKLAAEAELPIIEVINLDSVAIPNAVPTAEGALQIAMQETEITIDGMQALVIGYGRVGAAIASRLRCLGARVTVVNRSYTRFALAAKDGYSIFPWQNLADILPDIDVIFNTVPSMILDRERLLAMKKDTVIIDIASRPGGTDFAAAEELGIKAIHALSLPGKVAPISAGKVLARCYPRFLNAIWEDAEKAADSLTKGGALDDDRQ